MAAGIMTDGDTVAAGIASGSRVLNPHRVWEEPVLKRGAGVRPALFALWRKQVYKNIKFDSMV